MVRKLKNNSGFQCSIIDKEKQEKNIFHFNYMIGQIENVFFRS